MKVVSRRSTTHRRPRRASRALSQADSSSGTPGWVSLPSTTNLCSVGVSRMVTLIILVLVSVSTIRQRQRKYQTSGRCKSLKFKVGGKLKGYTVETVVSKLSKSRSIVEEVYI